MQKIRPLGIFVCVALIALIGPTAAMSQDWTSYLDPSLISEIVLHNGELYIATSGGLLIYDPASGDVDQFTNTIGLPSTFLTCLTFGKNGDLYVGTEDSGISRLQFVAGGFDITTLTATFHGLSDDRITSVSAWGDTIIYGTKKGAGLIIQGFAGTRFLKKDGLPSDLVYDVVADGKRAWIATDEGVVFLDAFGFLNNVSAGLPNTEVRVVARVDTTVWAGTAAGVAYFDESIREWVAAGIQTEAVFSLVYDGAILWAGSRARLYQNSGGGWTSDAFFGLFTKYSLNNSISQVQGLQPMPNGDVYVGVAEPVNERRGVNLQRFDGTSFEDIQFNSPPMNNLLRLSFDTDGSIWVSSTRFGVGKLMPDGRWLNYNSAVGDVNLNSRFFNLTCLADRSGKKWFATLSGSATSTVPMNELRDGSDDDVGNDVWFEHDIDSGGDDGLGSLRNVDAREDPVGNRWFLSDDALSPDGWWGISILSEDMSGWRRVNPTTTTGGMKSGNVTDVAFDPAGKAYVALRNYGVQLWFPGDFDKQTLFDLTGDSWQDFGRIGFEFDSEATILCLAYRADGAVWVGSTAGAYFFDTETLSFRHITANRGFGVGLLGNVVRDIVLDRDGNAWLATDLGLNRIARDDVNDIQAFTTAAAWQTQLSLFFPPDVVAPIANASLEALAMHPTRNLLYIATAGGLSVFDTGSLLPAQKQLVDIYLYPNPVRPDRGHVGLRIGNLTRPVVVDVYTLEGQRVSTRTVNTSDELAWDLTTHTGVPAAAGVYMVRVSDGNVTVIKTLSILQ